MGGWTKIEALHGGPGMGVLGSGENGVQKFREQGAWLQKCQGAGTKLFFAIFSKNLCVLSAHFLIL